MYEPLLPRHGLVWADVRPVVEHISSPDEIRDLASDPELVPAKLMECSGPLRALCIKLLQAPPEPLYIASTSAMCIAALLLLMLTFGSQITFGEAAKNRPV